MWTPTLVFGDVDTSQPNSWYMLVISFCPQLSYLETFDILYHTVSTGCRFWCLVSRPTTEQNALVKGCQAWAFTGCCRCNDLEANSIDEIPWLSTYRTVADIEFLIRTYMQNQKQYISDMKRHARSRLNVWVVWACMLPVAQLCLLSGFLTHYSGVTGTSLWVSHPLFRCHGNLNWGIELIILGDIVNESHIARLWRFSGWRQPLCIKKLRVAC